MSHPAAPGPLLRQRAARAHAAAVPPPGEEAGAVRDGTGRSGAGSGAAAVLTERRGRGAAEQRATQHGQEQPARADPARGADSRHRPTRQTRLGPSLGSRSPPRRALFL